MREGKGQILQKSSSDSVHCKETMPMNALNLETLAPGTVLGWVTGRVRDGHRETWDAALEKVWPEFLAEMSSNAGYQGAAALWAVETGEVSVVGIWQSMEHRLAYEARSSGKVRAIFNALLEDPPTRVKQVVAKVHWAR